MDSFTLSKLEFDKVRQILARYCRCSLGRDLALRISPSRRPDTVRLWLSHTSQMVQALVQVGTPPFGGITDITEQLHRAVPAGGASGEDFAAIASTLTGCGNVKLWLAKIEELGEIGPAAAAISAEPQEQTDAGHAGAPERDTRLTALGEHLSNFDGEIRAIQAVVDERGEVRDSASPRLANIRREIESCQHQIREVVYSFVRRGDIATFLQSTSVQLHEDRYVLPVKAENRGRLPGVVHRSSHTGATVFVEPAECVELNNRLVRLHDEQRDEIIRLLAALAIRVHGRHEEIRHSLHTLAQLDLITAKAQYAYEFEMTCPDISDGRELQFFHARHPLLVEQAYQQELAGLPAEERHAVVPIDVRLGSDFDLLIITGSNTGGKTVAMKTVALLMLMAQSGLHIPVRRGSSTPIFREVLLDVGDEQSLQQSLSTFGAHLKRIKHILRRADRYSLVLLDELGSGTDPEEGGAMGGAILDELRSIGCLGMVTTHLGVLKAYAYNHPRVDNASVEFNTETLRPTYKLLIGQPGESHAIVVAQHYGLPRRVIANAKKHLPRQGSQLRQAIRATAASRQASETALTEANAARQEAEQRAAEYQTKLAQMERLSREFSDWVGSLPAMQPGDPIFVRRLNKMGTLERLQLSRQLAIINVDKMQVEVPLQELMPSLGDPVAREEIASLRRQIGEQARSAQLVREEAERIKQEYHRSLSGLQNRRRQFDAWVEAISKVAVGDEVPIARPPGRGKVSELNLAAGRVVVETSEGKQELKLQELFPQAGAEPHGRGKHGKGRQGTRGTAGAAEPQDKPVYHRRPDSRAVKENRKTLLETPPGKQVYVIPFHKRATLIRVIAEKDIAVVQAGAFEMQVPLADIEPVKD